VDSSVAAVLVDRALRDSVWERSRLIGVFRITTECAQNESKKFSRNLHDNLGLHLVAVDATERFMTKLAGVTVRRQNSKIIGNEFIAVFDEEAAPHREKQKARSSGCAGDTLPDVIESRSVRGPSQVIRRHHNVGGLPDKMEAEADRALKDLFKDEVRRIGSRSGKMRRTYCKRQAVSRAGLAVAEILEMVRRARRHAPGMRIVVARSRRLGFYQKIWQSFAVLLPVIRSSDGRPATYAYTCAVRAVHSEDRMTADWVLCRMRSSRQFRIGL